MCRGSEDMELAQMLLTRNPELVAVDMDGDLVMLSITSGEYYGLTGIAPYIWKALETPIGLDDLISSLLDEFEVEEAQLRQDVDLFLRDMKRNGLLKEQ
jgi:hypothetical protein